MFSLIVVLARNSQDFEAWCRDSGLSPRDPDVVYISRPDKLRGINSAKVIRCPRWGQHPEAGEIDELVRTRLEQRRRP